MYYIIYNKVDMYTVMSIVRSAKLSIQIFANNGDFGLPFGGLSF